MNQCAVDAISRSKIPDCFAGPMSLAMQDRRVLAAEVERLREELFAVVDEVAQGGGLTTSTPYAAGTPVPLERAPHEMVAERMKQHGRLREAAAAVVFALEGGDFDEILEPLRIAAVIKAPPANGRDDG